MSSYLVVYIWLSIVGLTTGRFFNACIEDTGLCFWMTNTAANFTEGRLACNLQQGDVAVINSEIFQFINQSLS